MSSCSALAVLVCIFACVNSYADFTNTYTTAYKLGEEDVLIRWMNKTLKGGSPTPVEGKNVSMIIAVDTNGMLPAAQENLNLTIHSLQHTLESFSQSKFNTPTVLIPFNSNNSKAYLTEKPQPISDRDELIAAIGRLTLNQGQAEGEYLAKMTEEMRLASGKYELMVVCSPVFFKEDTNFKMRITSFRKHSLYQLKGATTTNSYHVIMTSFISQDTDLQTLKTYIAGINPRFDANNFYNYIV